MAEATAIGKSVPAPVGGWDTQSPLSEMPAKNAIILDNLYPETTQVRIRKGRRVHQSVVAGEPVETLAEWAGPSSKVLIAACNGSIYDVTAFGGTPTSLGSGFTNNRWQTANFRSALVMVNGVDTPQKFDGSTLADAVYTGSGLTPSKLVHVNSYRSRLYFVEKDSMKVWYGDVNNITGALTALDLSSLFIKGGYLMLSGTWTRDGGNGADDYMVFMSSEGETLVYQGDYPGGTSWSLIGRFVLPAPLGRRAFTYLGPDLCVVSKDGFVPLSRALQMGRIADGTNRISYNINKAFTDAAGQYGTNFGWEPTIFPTGNMVVINVPISEGSVSYQFVMNLMSGAWCRYIGHNASTWEFFNENLYFGGVDGNVYQAEYGMDDSGDLITWEMKPAYNYFGYRGRLKQFKMVRPTISTTQQLTFNAEMQVDFIDRMMTATETVGQGSSLWNVSKWNVSPWGKESITSTVWYGVSGVGYCGSFRIKASTKNVNFSLISYDVLFELGGFI